MTPTEHPSTMKKINLYVPKSMLDQLNQAKNLTGRTVSQIVRDAIRAYVEKK